MVNLLHEDGIVKEGLSAEDDGERKKLLRSLIRNTHHNKDIENVIKPHGSARERVASRNRPRVNINKKKQTKDARKRLARFYTHVYKHERDGSRTRKPVPRGSYAALWPKKRAGHQTTYKLFFRSPMGAVHRAAMRARNAPPPHPVDVDVGAAADVIVRRPPTPPPVRRRLGGKQPRAQPVVRAPVVQPVPAVPAVPAVARRAAPGALAGGALARAQKADDARKARAKKRRQELRRTRRNAQYDANQRNIERAISRLEEERDDEHYANADAVLSRLARDNAAPVSLPVGNTPIARVPNLAAINAANNAAINAAELARAATFIPMSTRELLEDDNDDWLEGF